MNIVHVLHLFVCAFVSRTKSCTSMLLYVFLCLVVVIRLVGQPVAPFLVEAIY